MLYRSYECWRGCLSNLSTAPYGPRESRRQPAHTLACGTATTTEVSGMYKCIQPVEKHNKETLYCHNATATSTKYLVFARIRAIGTYTAKGRDRPPPLPCLQRRNDPTAYPRNVLRAAFRYERSQSAPCAADGRVTIFPLPLHLRSVGIILYVV